MTSSLNFIGEIKLDLFLNHLCIETLGASAADSFKTNAHFGDVDFALFYYTQLGIGIVYQIVTICQESGIGMPLWLSILTALTLLIRTVIPVILIAWFRATCDTSYIKI